MYTSDPQDELFDVVNKDDEIIGCSKRSTVHKDQSLIHRSIAVLLFREGELFLQRRSKTKDTYPGFWTASCSGHVSQGQTYREAARREIFEELGIVINDSLRFIFKTIVYYPNETEYVSVFRYDTNQEIKINKSEICEFAFFPLNQKFIQKILPSLPITPDLSIIVQRHLNTLVVNGKT